MTQIYEAYRVMIPRKYTYIALTLLVIALIILFFSFEKPILRALLPLAERIRDTEYNFLIVGAIIIVCSILPIPGYNPVISMCGFLYGFPLGFLPAYVFALIGASISFGIYRSLCIGYARKLASKGGNFQMLSMAVEEGGFKLILLLRLTPFPYPYSNAFFASIHSVSFSDFFFATVISLVKLLLFVFIGSRFQNLSVEMDQTSRTINYVSIAIGLLILVFSAWYIYMKMSTAVEQAKRRFLEKFGSEDESSIFSSECDGDEDAEYYEEISSEGGDREKLNPNP